MPEGVQGNPPPQGGQGGDAPQSVTAEQVNELVNKAITGRLKDFGKGVEKTIAESIGKSLETFAGTLDEKLTTLTAPKVDDKTKPPARPEDDPIVRGLQKQNADFQKKLDAITQERDAEKAKARDVSMRGRVTDELTKAGFSDALRAKMALGHLLDSEKRVRLDETGESILFRDNDGQDVDLATGLKEWAKGEEAKLFMPPRGVGGSGSRPSTTPGSKPAETPIGERLAEFFLG